MYWKYIAFGEDILFSGKVFFFLNQKVLAYPVAEFKVRNEILIHEY